MGVKKWGCGGVGTILPLNWFELKIQFSYFLVNQLNLHPAHTHSDIYQRIKTQISDGVLRPGGQLPSSRALASDLGVSRTTVVTAYEQLAAEGYIETSLGTRARVAPGITPPSSIPSGASQPAAQMPRLSAYGRRLAGLVLPQPQHQPFVPSGERPDIEFLYGALSPQDFPILVWRRAYDRALLQRQTRLYYGAPEGELELRVELQGYLRRARGLSCIPEQIIIVHGSQQAIDLCARVLLDPGDTVVIEEPCYLMARRAFEAAGAVVVATPVDDHGLVTQDLPQEKTALAYVTPSHQFPLGAVMSIGRRQELLSWATRSTAWIIEDDYDGEFRYGLRPVDTLQSLDTAGSVIYVGTFSKALSPQMRLGYLVLPLPLVAHFRQAKQVADRHAPRLEQVVLASLIRGGAYERHIRRIRRANERRRSTLMEAIAKQLPGCAHVEGAASGLHVVLWLEGICKADEAALVAQARAHQLGVWPVSPLYSAGTTWRRRDCAGLVLGYAGLELAEIELGISRLAEVLSQMRPLAT
jgi:GntR family transcriptional regulator/MocR family aminotransferase